MFRVAARPHVLRLVPSLLLIAAAPATAAPIRYDFGGVVKHANSGPEVGSRFSGSFVYDPDASPIKTTPQDGGGVYNEFAFGTHRPDDPAADGSGLEVRFGDGSVPMRVDGLTVESYSTPGSNDNPSLVFRGGPQAPGRGEAYLVLRGGEGLGGDDPLPPQLLLDRFTTHDLVVLGPLGPDGEYPVPDLVFVGAIDTLTATPVPEPAWTVAALLGAAAYFARRRHVAD